VVDIGRNAGPLSAPAYFGCVALVTALGFGGAMLWRPAFSHSVLQAAGIERIPKPAPGSFFVVRVAPLFESHCAGCHGESRQKVQLRLDSFAAVMNGGKIGAVILPGRPQDSELFRRITLPPSDDKAMPPSGKTPLTGDEVTVIRLWIEAGASGAESAGAIKGAPKLVEDVKFPEVDPVKVQQLRAPLAAQVQHLQARYPGILSYESRNSADLDLNAAFRGAAFGDGDLQALLPLKDRLVEADLSETAITDASASVLGAMTSLRVLRLRDTKITARTANALSSLKSLKSLTLKGTEASKENLMQLRQRGVAIFGADDEP
jgi:hypothetical protein